MYRVYDEWDGKEFIGVADTIEEMMQMYDERYDATDGQCEIWYYTPDGRAYYLKMD